MHGAMNKYSQFRAMIAIARASFRSSTRSPSSVVVTLVLPMIFILVFGFLGGNGISLDLGLHNTSDTSIIVYEQLVRIPGVNILKARNNDNLYRELEKG